MSQLPDHVIAPGDRFAVNDQAPAHAGAEDDPQHHRVALKFIIPGFRQRKTVGIVINAYLTIQALAEIGTQRASACRRNIGGEQRAVIRHRQPRHAQPDAALPPAKRIGLQR